MAGAMTAGSPSVPKRASISHQPLRVPGTPTDLQPTLFSRRSVSM
jgi:hypothetical protein